MIRLKKELEKIPLIHFIDSLKKVKIPYYLNNDTSNFHGHQIVKIEYSNYANSYELNVKLTDSIINYFDSIYLREGTKLLRYSQKGITNHKMYIAIPCNFKDEITYMNSNIYNKINSVQNVFLEEYSTIKYQVYYFVENTNFNE